MSASDVRRSVDSGASSPLVAERILSQLGGEDRRRVIRSARQSGSQVTELAALRDLRWTRCAVCGETMIVGFEAVEPTSCPTGHSGRLVPEPSEEQRVVIDLVGSAVDRWLAGVPLEAAIVRRLEEVHHLAVTQDAPMVAMLAGNMRSDLATWPTAWLVEVAAIEDQALPEIARASRMAAAIDDALHDLREDAARGKGTT